MGEAEATEMRLKANAYQRQVFIIITQIAMYPINWAIGTTKEYDPNRLTFSGMARQQ